jgi:DNA-binding LacI/PurR family transcriptional regulator
MRYQTDGIVVTSAQMSSDIIALSEQLEVPIAMFNRSVDNAPLPSVHTDNYGGGRLLADRMIAAGANTFLVVRGDPKGSTSRERVEGFCAALDAHGIPRNRIVQIDGGSNYDFARAATRDYLTSNPWPDAIFGVNDIMAMGCADAVRTDHGRRIPEDLMLAGFDGVREGQYSAYALTTVRQPIERMVEHTLDLVLAPDAQTRIGSRPPLVLPGDFIAGRTVPASR